MHSKNWKGINGTDTLNGPGSIIRSKILNKTGLSDPEFFGPEDMELSIRLKVWKNLCKFRFSYLSRSSEKLQ